jgi:hypothetical protein
MSIKDFLCRINPLRQIRTFNGVGRAPRDAEDISFDDKGNIVRHSFLDKFFLSLLIVLVSTLSYGLGRLSVDDNGGGVSIEFDESIAGFSTAQGADLTQTGKPEPKKELGQSPAGPHEVVVSKSGKKYHFLHCAGAKQIKEENKIFFATASVAESAGYTLAANCKPK